MQAWKGFYGIDGDVCDVFEVVVNLNEGCVKLLHLEVENCPWKRQVMLETVEVD